MDLVFGNPNALWALLGIPAVLAVHFLQRKAKTTPVTTLFLIEQVFYFNKMGIGPETVGHVCKPTIIAWNQPVDVLDKK